ncbi:ferredoxin [Glutamicibacter nicotianae]|uniref:ferredoxin n=1 Tax=Glutamicibacter nicotianae TaxID=37929 RepID=UPI00167F3599|nr:ferredoxin [Glutamicibacter nicotianae]
MTARAQGDHTTMQQVSCTECLAKVQVRKTAWEQTSIQWTGEALELCRERPACPSGGMPRDQFVGCETLRAALRDATARGSLVLAEPAAR